MTTDEQNKWIKWIDESSYETLLRRWRFGPVGDPLFQNPVVGQHYSKVMFAKRDIDPEAAVEASKSVGWDRS